MKQSLTFKDHKSDKFWQIETSGKTYTVTYGKTGTTGTSQTKKFGSEEKCLEEAEKLLSEKLKKGYKFAITPKKSVDKKFELSDHFFDYLKSQVSSMEEKSVATKLSKADWNAYAKSAYSSILKYWEQMLNTKMRVGSFIIGWNDSENNGIDLDYVESNEADFYSDGATARMAFRVIEFDSFFSKVFKSDVEEIQNEEYFNIVKDLLCKLTKEVVQASTKEVVFLKIPKRSEYKIWFYHWHDEEMIAVYDSNNGALPIEGYSKQKDMEEKSKKSLNSFFKYGSITIDGEVPGNIGKASEAFSAQVKTKDPQLPAGFGELIKLEKLDITLSKVKLFPPQICKLLKLEKLSLTAPAISRIPDDIRNLKSLKQLYISKTKIEELCGGIGELKKLEKLQLIDNKLLKLLPKEIGQLTNLKELSISDSDIKSLDDEVFTLRKLEWLVLSRTQITKLSNKIGSLSKLDTLWIDGTQISTLPESIFELKKLSFISVTNSKVSKKTADELIARFKKNGRKVEIKI
ncbi:MAG: WGR domain-containing protein [Cytophagia bacterium]|nr:WGR domain-containing protein [Cytophagia bacterium]